MAGGRDAEARELERALKAAADAKEEYEAVVQSGEYRGCAVLGLVTALGFGHDGRRLWGIAGVVVVPRPHSKWRPCQAALLVKQAR